MTTPCIRKHHSDERFDSDISDVDYSNKLFLRMVAKRKRFCNVNFRYTIFDTCYFRKCVFDSCDFTGCRFSATNLTGSTFSDCRFDYATFERTLVDNDILKNGFPGFENLKLRFARTLRTNYLSLGDSESANKAITLELDATRAHLQKAWHSNEAYYRKKYSGVKRVTVFLEWLRFRLLDLVWGNGESWLKLLRAVGFVLLLMCLYDVFMFGDSSRVSSYGQSLLRMPIVFLGTAKPSGYSESYLAVILFLRLMILALFISIVIKRFGRR